MFTFPSQEWRYISMDAKDLIKNCLVVEQKERYTVDKALWHAWFGILDDEKEEISDSVVEKLRSNKWGTRLQKAAMNIFVKYLNDVDVDPMWKEFEIIDRDKCGIIYNKEMKQALKNSNIELKGSEINSIVWELDFNLDGHISYSEFLSATVNLDKFLTDEKCMAVYKSFDLDDSG